MKLYLFDFLLFRNALHESFIIKTLILSAGLYTLRLSSYSLLAVLQFVSSKGTSCGFYRTETALNEQANIFIGHLDLKSKMK